MSYHFLLEGFMCGMNAKIASILQLYLGLTCYFIVPIQVSGHRSCSPSETKKIYPTPCWDSVCCFPISDLSS